MTTILGIEPYRIIQAAVILGFVAIFATVLLAGPSSILDGAFGVLSQSVATAQVAMGSLVASAGGIVAQGMSVATNAIAEFGMIATQIATSTLGIVSSIFDVAASMVMAGAAIVTSVFSLGAQIVSQGAVAAAQLAIQFGSAYFVIKGTIEETRIYVYQVAAQNAIIAISQFIQMTFLSIANLFTTLFTSLAGAVGQLLSIPMIMLFGYVSIASAFVTIVPGVIGSLISVFTTLFSKIVTFFTGTGDGTFLGAVKDIPEKLKTAIEGGFEKVVLGLPKALFSALTGG